MKLTRIEYSAKDGLARITIANEAKHNAMDGTFCAAFAKVSMAALFSNQKLERVAPRYCGSIPAARISCTHCV